MAQLGDPAGGLVLIDEVMAQVERPGWEERCHYAEILRIKGWIFSLKGDPEGAERAYLASLSIGAQKGPRIGVQKGPPEATERGCPGSEQEGPARVAQCPHERRSGARGRCLFAHLGNPRGRGG